MWPWTKTSNKGQFENYIYISIQANATNIPVLLMTGFVVQGHKYFNFFWQNTFPTKFTILPDIIT